MVFHNIQLQFQAQLADQYSTDHKLWLLSLIVCLWRPSWNMVYITQLAASTAHTHIWRFSSVLIVRPYVTWTAWTSTEVILFFKYLCLSVQLNFNAFSIPCAASLSLEWVRESKTFLFPCTQYVTRFSAVQQTAVHETLHFLGGWTRGLWDYSRSVVGVLSTFVCTDDVLIPQWAGHFPLPPCHHHGSTVFVVTRRGYMDLTAVKRRGEECRVIPRRVLLPKNLKTKGITPD